MNDYSIIPNHVLANPTRQPQIVDEVAYVRLTKGMFALIDSIDAELVGAYGLWRYRQHRADRGYASCNVQSNKANTIVDMHIILAIRIYGSTHSGMDIDHINGTNLSPNLLDNRRSNLRMTSRNANISNSTNRRNGTTTSQYPGVCLHAPRPRWRSKIHINHRNHHLGYHTSEEDAATVYQLAMGLWNRHGITPDCALGMTDADFLEFVEPYCEEEQSV